MSEMTKSLRDRRLNVWEQAKGLADKAAEENRAFTAEEQGQWDVLNEELDRLDARIRSALDAEKRAKEADEAFNAIAGKPATGPQGGDGGQFAGELRSFLKGEQGAPKFFDVRPAGPVNYRALSTLTSGAGGSTVPTSFYDRLVQHLIEVSGIMQTEPTVLNTQSGEALQIPKTTSHSTAATAAQGSTLPSSDPTFSLATLGAFKYGILLSVARELIDDSGVDLEGYLAMQAGRALGNKFGNDLVNGTGTNQPNGLLSLATVAVTGTATGGAVTYDDLVDLQYSVIAPYRASRSCYWIMRDAIVGELRKLKDTTGQPIWQPSVQIGAPDLLLGKPIAVDPFMPAKATGAKTIGFGDFAQFFVRMVGGIRFERSDDFAFGSDTVTFRAVLRGDGTLVDQTGAIKLFLTASS